MLSMPPRVREPYKYNTWNRALLFYADNQTIRESSQLAYAQPMTWCGAGKVTPKTAYRQFEGSTRIAEGP